jgi:hypothetical protein
MRADFTIYRRDTAMASALNRESTTQAARAAWAIDADGHVLEPPTALPDYIEAKFRDRAPHVVES